MARSSIAGCLRAQGKDFIVSQDSGGLLGGVEDAIHDSVVRGNAVAFQPEENVGFAAHRADFDDLLETEKMRGHSTVDGVGKGRIVLVKGLDNGRRVNACGGAKRVAADNGIVRGDRGVGGPRNFFAILFQAGKVAIDQPHKAQIDEHQLHGSIADTLAEGICGGVNLVCARGDGGERIGDGQAAVAMTVPVDANFLAAGLYNFLDGEFDEIVHALRGSVAHGVTEDDGPGAAADGGGVEALNGFGVRANSVFGDVHRGQAVVHGVLHGFLGGAFEMVYGPVFDEAANGAGTEKRGRFNGDADALGNLDDGADVTFHGASGAIRANLHPRGGNLAREGFGVGKGAGACAGESDVQRVDAKGFHQVENFDFLFDCGVVDRRVLQAVAQGFVIQENARAGGNLRRRG